MAHSDIDALRVVHQLQKTQHRIEVVQRLSDPHHNNIGNGLSRFLLDKNNLIQNLPCAEPANQPAKGGGAEGAAHQASHLTGDADGVAMAIAHQHRLHAVPVRQPPEIFDCAVQLRDLFPLHLGHCQNAALTQRLPQCFGQVGHLLEGFNPPVQPLKNLFLPKCALTQIEHELPQLLSGTGFNVNHIVSSALP